MSARADETAFRESASVFRGELIRPGDVHGPPVIELSVANFMAPVENALRATILSARTAGRALVPAGLGHAAAPRRVPREAA